MERIGSRGVIFGVVVAVILQSSVAQTVHVVGDTMGWTVPPGGAQAYVDWAADKQFVVGDFLTFNFRTNEHDILRVPRATYDTCTSDNPIGDIILTGPANISLTSPGEHFYICTIGRHCLAGQKLAITVSTTPGASPPPSSTTPTLRPPPTTPTTTPSPSDNPNACAPTPVSVPEPSPTVRLPPVQSLPNSSSPAVVASLSVTLLSIGVVGLLY